MPPLKKEMIAPEKKKFLTPVTTPTSSTNDDRCLLPFVHENKEKELPLYVKYKPPYAILAASFIQIIGTVLRNSRLMELGAHFDTPQKRSPDFVFAPLPSAIS
ncbi:hypothetical protein Trydic_g17857 [Trypoxylus dichotomus]